MEEAIPDFSEVYDSYYRRVLEYAGKLLGRDGAADVAQEVFIRIHKNLGSLRDPSKLTSWVYAITINAVRDTLRRSATQADSSPGVCGSADALGEPQDPVSRIPDTASRTPEETAIRHEMVRCFLDYVEQLPKNYYDVYALHELEELSNEQIAERLSLSLGTVKIRLHRAREQLYDELRHNCRCYYNERGELMGERKRD